MKRAWISWLLVGSAAGAAVTGSGCTSSNPAPSYKDRAFMIAPANCGSCHGKHFSDWSASMHAKATDDPVFLAMNARGQRETNGKLGNFCVQCHAPMAVRDHQIKPGMDLRSLNPIYKGITCYFCHSIDGVDEDDGGHANASVHLADDLVMRGELSNPGPVANPIHASTYSAFQDSSQLANSQMCGNCHDIDSPAGAPIERTFADWSTTIFGHVGTSNDGEGCAAQGTCHMQGTRNVRVAEGGPTTRTYRAHDFPAVDVPLEIKPPDPSLIKRVQDTLDDSLLFAALCVTTDVPAIRVILDNGTAGHAWPSGAAQDRRAWVEVVAYRADGSVMYSSGVVPAGTAVTDTAGPDKDPDLWLLRDCMFDSQNKETHNFWEAATYSGYELPPLLTSNQTSMLAYKTHVERAFPQPSANNPDGHLRDKPTKVTLRVLLQPVGLDVLNDLVDSGDLDPGPDGAIIANMPTFEVSLLHPFPAGAPQGMQWPALPSQVSQGLVLYPVNFTDTIPGASLGPGTCTASSMTLPVAQAYGPSKATCTAPSPSR